MYPVYISARLTNDQWNWLCDNIGTPQRDWLYKIGQVWFLKEEDLTHWMLKWS